MDFSDRSALIGDTNHLPKGTFAFNTEEVAATLQRWYAAHSVVRSLWAFVESKASDERSIEIAIEITPTPDGDDVSPTWIGRAARWERDLQEATGRAVRLQRVDSALSEDSLRRSGILIATQRWRDPSYAES